MEGSNTGGENARLLSTIHGVCEQEGGALDTPPVCVLGDQGSGKPEQCEAMSEDAIDASPSTATVAVDAVWELAQDLDKVLVVEEDNAVPRYELVDSAEAVADMMSALVGVNQITFDLEGVDLSRSGPITVASIKPLSRQGDSKRQVAFLVDIKVLQAEAIDALRGLLESEKVEKVMFDCRTDSDALFHQHGITLRNVIDLQAYDQALDHHRGTYRLNLGYGRKRFVSGMEKTCEKRLPETEIRWIKNGQPSLPPHKTDMRMWAKRPMTQDMKMYAAGDAHAIDLLYWSMVGVGISAHLVTKVREASEKRTRIFRDQSYEVTYHSNRQLVMVDSSIL
mmetsp:Transcript_14105/g.20856  ORF Transcript_14105/g.20856 Transcript_14105/m.20856 type:complete len:337 (-) Transcript_14105:230-1240(-)